MRPTCQVNVEEKARCEPWSLLRLTIPVWSVRKEESFKRWMIRTPPSLFHVKEEETGNFEPQVNLTQCSGVTRDHPLYSSLKGV